MYKSNMVAFGALALLDDDGKEQEHERADAGQRNDERCRGYGGRLFLLAVGGFGAGERGTVGPPVGAKGHAAGSDRGRDVGQQCARVSGGRGLEQRLEGLWQETVASDNGREVIARDGLAHRHGQRGQHVVLPVLRFLGPLAAEIEHQRDGRPRGATRGRRPSRGGRG